MASLIILDGPDTDRGKRFVIQADRTLIGRSSECDVVLNAAAVSRKHAAIQRQGPEFYIEDQQSRNGTIVNGTKVQRSLLRPGDKVLICDVLLEFSTGTTPAAAAREDGVGTAPGVDKPIVVFPPVSDDEDHSSVEATFDLGQGPRSSWNLQVKPEDQIRVIREISEVLATAVTKQEIYGRVLDGLFKSFPQADRGFFIVPTATGAAAVATKSRLGDDDAEMRFSRTIVQRAFSEKRALLSVDAASDARFNMAQSISDFQIRSLICAPIVGSDGEPLGVLQLDAGDQRRRFLDLDLQLLAVVASQVALSLDNARMHEEQNKRRALQRDMETAAQMQAALLPKSAPDVPGYHFFQHYNAAFEVGGDYYDYVSLPEGRFAAVVGDVAGKGVSAAILMAVLAGDVRSWLVREPDAAKALGRINEAFCQHGWEDRFVTMAVAVVDPAKEELTLVNAGHMPPLLRDAAGKVEEIGADEAGVPLGVVDGFEYESYRRPLRPGDQVTIFTDGFSEAMNAHRELFGLERLAELAADTKISPCELGKHILEQVRGFVGDYPQSDDMCLLCFGRNA